MKLSITFSRKRQWIYIIDFLILFICMKQYLITVLNFPVFINFFPDIINVFLFIMVILPNFQKMVQRNLKPIFLFIFFFLVIILLGWIINTQSVLLLIWGIRKTFRYFILLIVVILYFKESNILHTLNIQFFLILLNVILCSYFFYAKGYYGDYLGGIFGIEKGANGYMMLQLSLNTAFYIPAYLHKKVKLYRLAIVIIASLYLSALAGLQLYFIALVPMVVAMIIIRKPNFRAGLLAVTGGIALMVAYVFLLSYHSENTVFDLEYLLFYTQNAYSGSGGLTRLNGIQVINDTFFKGNIVYNLLGYGLGSAEYSSVSMFTSSLYQRYYHMPYYWFSYTITYLEMGFAGLIAYLTFFLYTAIYAIKHLASSRLKLWRDYSLLIAANALIFFVYNASFRGDQGYLMFFFLAVPFCMGAMGTDQEPIRKVPDGGKQYRGYPVK